MSKCTIEFIGGPFDGHRQTVAKAPDHLAAEVVMPVSRDMFRLLEGRVPTRSAPVSSVAIYRRDKLARACRYHFVGARSPNQLRLVGKQFG